VPPDSDAQETVRMDRMTRRGFAAAAALLTWAAGISLTFLMAAALGGFLLRLALLTVAVVLVKGQPWMRLLPFALTMVGAHLGLLVWEVRHVSASLAYPGLRPTRTTTPTTTRTIGGR
jgi:hypothetical protein